MKIFSQYLLKFKQFIFLLSAMNIITLFFPSNPSYSSTSSEYIKKNAVKFTKNLPRNIVDELSNKKLILVGENHGTKELPATFFELAKELSAKKPLIIGLEFPHDLQPELNKFLETGEQNILRNTKFFSNPQFHSGRGSKAMVSLLNNLREISNLKVFSLDVPLDFKGKNRDSEMARNILRQMDESPDRLALVYTGNIHSRLTKGTPWDDGYKTMGSEIIRLSSGKLKQANVKAINLKYNEGTVWQCRPDKKNDIVCKDWIFGPIDSQYATAVPYQTYFLNEPQMVDGHDATIFLRKIHSSMPF